MASVATKTRIRVMSAISASGVCERLRSGLSSLCCESCVVTLTLVSALAVGGEMLVDYDVLTDPTMQREGNVSERTSATSDSGNRAKDNPVTSPLYFVQKVFHYASLTIAALFFIEMILKLAVFRKKFLVQPWNIVDLMVVLGTVAVEAVFEAVGRRPEMEACTLVVLFRLWRLPHACHIKAEEVRRDLEQDIDLWKAGKSKLEDKCLALEARSNRQKEKIERLEREILVLKTAVSQSQLTTQKSSNQTTLPNGSVLRDTVDGSSTKQWGPSHHVNFANASPNPAHLQRYVSADSEDDEDRRNVTAGVTPSWTRHQDRGGDTEEDTVEEEDSSGELPKGQYCRSGSESSLSCQALEHEVHVQIEGLDTEVSDPARSTTEAGSVLNTPVQTRKKVRKREEREGLIQEPPGGGPVYYENEGYNPELEEGEGEQGGVLVCETDGSRTYRNADGIPMTDL